VDLGHLWSLNRFGLFYAKNFLAGIFMISENSLKLVAMLTEREYHFARKALARRGGIRQQSDLGPSQWEIGISQNTK
jgi:hypothetical protein